jgi:hypothetical protein
MLSCCVAGYNQLFAKISRSLWACFGGKFFVSRAGKA